MYLVFVPFLAIDSTFSILAWLDFLRPAWASAGTSKRLILAQTQTDRNRTTPGQRGKVRIARDIVSLKKLQAGGRPL
jgi:hypothetical protein